MHKPIIVASALLMTLAFVPVGSASEDCEYHAGVFGAGAKTCDSHEDDWPGYGSDYESWDTYGTTVYFGSTDVVTVGYYVYQCNNSGGQRSCTDGDSWTDEHVIVLSDFGASVAQGQIGGQPGWHVCYLVGGSWNCPIFVNA